MQFVLVAKINYFSYVSNITSKFKEIHIPQRNNNSHKKYSIQRFYSLLFANLFSLFE